MIRTLVIYDVNREYAYNDVINYRKYSFDIQYPDGETEIIVYAEIDGEKNDDDNTYYRKYKKLNPVIREQHLQRIINNLEEKGYNVPSNQISLFMSHKTDKLIMQQKGKPQKTSHFGGVNKQYTDEVIDWEKISMGTVPKMAKGVYTNEAKKNKIIIRKKNTANTDVAKVVKTTDKDMVNTKRRSSEQLIKLVVTNTY